MIDVRKSYQEIYKDSWNNFVKGLLIRHLPKSCVLDSWNRCKKLNVDPWQKSVVETVDPAKLANITSRNKLFLEVSKPTLQNLFSFVEGSGFVIALSDSDGCLMEVFGDDQVRHLVEKGNWTPGAIWTEASAGTNIVGTALYLDRAIALIGYEHYCRCSHNYQGAGAPIHDSDGKIIGVIALAGAIDKAHPHTLGMIVAAAHAIETQFEMKKAWQECALSNQHKNVIVNSIYEGLLVTDKRGNVILVNERLNRILNVSEQEILGLPVKSMFSAFLLDQIEKNNGRIIDIQDEIIVGNHKTKCTISSQKIVSDQNFNGLVFVINELTRAKNLLNHMALSDTRFTFEDVIGDNPKFQSSVNLAKLVSTKESNILLLGESGTGKDIFAQSIHNASKRRSGPFVAINCGAIPKELIGSELFGYSDGAFTGAKKGGKMGKFELADGGTLFLDEIGEMPLEQQRVLLRVLEERKIVRLGGQDAVPVNVRIIAATNMNLEQEVKKGFFRQDLFFRLNVFTIRMVPLRERKDDIKLFVESFLKKYTTEPGKLEIKLAQEAWNLLLYYDWPGNVRELQNAIERALVLCDGQYITPDMFDFCQYVEPAESAQPRNVIKSSLQDYEAEILINQLKQNNWNISRTSIQLNISRTTLYRKMGILGIKIPAEFRNSC